MITALAGRRVDEVGTEPPCFPIENVSLVRARLRTLLREREVSGLVCSAACGADLLALDAAGELGLRRRIILPFERSRFRDVSVTDRPGDWGPLFDRIVDEVGTAGDLVVIGDAAMDDDAYATANAQILNETERLAEESQRQALTVIVWDGRSRGEGDLTAQLADDARRRGLTVAEVSTLKDSGA
ncbi:MAG TPA: hypothetical protein VKV73_28045 [Chloroflexota bacterium]|nr:hypothetical protein [Chloroflexota bacterium]